MKTKTITINLESLIDLSTHLSEINDEFYILNASLLSLMGKLRIAKACVLKLQGDYYYPIIKKGRVEIKFLPYFDLNKSYYIDENNNELNILKENGFVYLQPVKIHDNIIAIFCLASHIDKTVFENEELNYVNLVSTITANSLHNLSILKSLEDEKSKAERQNQVLMTLFEMSNDFSSLLSKDEILKFLSLRIMGQLTISRFAIFLEKNNTYNTIINRYNKDFPDSFFESIKSITKITLIDNLDDSFKSKEFLININSKLISPVTVQGKIKGFLLLGKKMTGENFTDENLQFIEALGNMAASSLENERLFLEELEKKRLESELLLALEIQKNLLPQDIPNIDGYEISGLSIPSRHVGGDYFDFISINNHQLLIAIADVSGKGMPASLLMANVQAALRALSPLNLGLNNLVLRINDILYHNTTPDKFVTFFCGILDIEKSTLTYINAGHNPPIFLKNDGSIQYLTEGGLILGITDSIIPYSQAEIKLEKNDIILCYTDGITEAMNKKHQEYSEEKLIQLLIEYKSNSTNNITNIILDSVNKHAQGLQQYDDLTIIALKSVK